MSPAEVLDALLALARELELEVRRSGSQEVASGTYRLRGRLCVLVSSADPVAQQVAVLAAALRDHAPDACEARYLPPAVRAALEASDPAALVRRA